MSSRNDTIEMLVFVFFFVLAPRGTADEAFQHLPADLPQLREIHHIVERDPQLVWVDPHNTLAATTLENGPVTPKVQADYGHVAKILRDSNFLNMNVRYDGNDKTKPNLIRVQIFEGGWFGKSPIVEAVWFAPNERIWKDCRLGHEGWYVCHYPA